MQLEVDEQAFKVFEEFISQLQPYLQDNRRPQFYVPEQRQIINLKDNIISNTFIIYGPNDSGKKSSVMWAASFEKDIQLINIDCEIQSTQMQFITSIRKGVLKHSNLINQQKNNEKQMVMHENVRFDQLNKYIKISNKRFVIVIKKCQKIAQMKKPILFYNLLQWVNGPMKPYIGLIFLSRAFYFTQKLQKRVKSRLSAKTLTLMRPRQQKIVQIYLKRFNILKQKYQEIVIKQKKSHKKRDVWKFRKYQWLIKIISAISQNKGFTQFVKSHFNTMNNQFLNCMKLAILKHLSYYHMGLNKNQFNQLFVDFMKDANQHIGINYNINHVKQLSLYCILILSIITYMGLNNRLPYKLSNIFQIYRQLVLKKHNQFKSMQFSKYLFQNAFDELIDTRIIQLQKNGIFQSEKQINLSILPQHLAQIILQIQNIPKFIKQLVKI